MHHNNADTLQATITQCEENLAVLSKEIQTVTNPIIYGAVERLMDFIRVHIEITQRDLARLETQWTLAEAEQLLKKLGA